MTLSTRDIYLNPNLKTLIKFSGGHKNHNNEQENNLSQYNKKEYHSLS